MIWVLLSVLQTFVSCVPEPQRMRVFKHLARCHGGRVIRLDWAKIATLLYGDDPEQAKADKVLSCLQNTTVGKFACTQHLTTEPSDCFIFASWYFKRLFSDSDAAEATALDDSDSDGELLASLGMTGKYHARV